MNDSNRPTVTVIGLGPMGQAMVRALIAAGHPVTVWNRTPSRADALVAEGATRAPSPADAVRANDLVILSLTDYAAMYDILDDATDALDGKTLVNLSSDTPDATRAAARWAAGHGTDFIVGGVMVPAPMVGTDHAYVYYSGEEATVQAHADTLSVIGKPRYLGPDPRLAQLMYQAHLDVFLTTLASIAHAAALMRAAGVSATEFLPEVMQTVMDTPAMMGDDAGHAFDSGVHPGELSTTTMMGATAQHILETSRALDVDTALPGAVESLYRRAIDAGHGKDNWTSIYEIIKAPDTASATSLGMVEG